MAYKADGSWEPENDSVADGVTKITSQKSPLMRLAKTQGLQQANRRGLLNSSMAVGATQKAAYEAALPIASQDAGQTFQKNLSRQDTTQKTGLMNLDSQNKERLLDKELSSQMDRLQLDTQSREMIAAMSVAATERKDAASLIAAMENSYADMFGNITGNANIPADVRDQLNVHIGALRDANLNFVEQMYNIDLTWPSTGAPG